LIYIAVLFGSEIGYWSQTSNFVSFNRVLTGSTITDPTAQELSLLTCTLYMVATIFALPPVTSLFADGIGRRKTIIVAGILFAIAMTMQASAASVSYPASKALLWSGRALLGIPVAFSVTTSPMFLSEIAPKESRVSIEEYCCFVSFVRSFVRSFFLISSHINNLRFFLFLLHSRDSLVAYFNSP
jgi:MFS family permease